MTKLAWEQVHTALSNRGYYRVIKTDHPAWPYAAQFRRPNRVIYINLDNCKTVDLALQVCQEHSDYNIED